MRPCEGDLMAIRLVPKYRLLLLLFWSFQAAHAQRIQLAIEVTESPGQVVSNAAVFVNNRKFKADSLGMLSLTEAAGPCHISVTAAGHYPNQFDLVLGGDTTLPVVMTVRESLLSSVNVYASRNVYRNQMATHFLAIDDIKKMPVLLGEVDPLKTITLLPGIKSGGDGGGGIYVRGGGPDQNLFLLDGVPVYNPNHLLGFFSIFNGDAIKGIEAIKGGIPAEYGGRLSSVINVTTREGDKDSLKGSGGIGLISSRLSLEGPIKKGRSSFMISGRRTYIDEVAGLVAKKQLGGNGYFFFDVNAKADYIFDAGNSLNFTFYKGKDKFSYANTDKPGRERYFDALWGNTIAGLTWKNRLNGNLQHYLSVTYNDFKLVSNINYTTSGFIFASGLRDYQLKDDWKLRSTDWLRWKWGAQYTLHRFSPGAGSTTAGTQEFVSKISDQFAREAAGYVSMDMDISRRLNLIAGLRYSYFDQVGPTDRVVYDKAGVPTGETEHYKKGQSIAAYHYPEPRASAVYTLGGQSSLKASYTRMIQYLHLATTSAATFPSDVWTPVSKLIKPGISDQVSLGYYRTSRDNMWEMSAETYYKTLQHQLEFRPGAQLLLNQNIEAEMVFGTGKAYGIEMLLQKKRGRLTGWIGYTLSRSERTYAQLNDGKPFPYRYDRTHDVSIVANYSINRKWTFSGVIIYGTGNALTLPTGRFNFFTGINDAQSPTFNVVNQYGKLNDYRMPAYHRMDIAFTYIPHPDSKRFLKGSWVFSINNIYNRYNPYFIYLDTDQDTHKVVGKEVYLFPITPGITYNFKF